MSGTKIKSAAAASHVPSKEQPEHAARAAPGVYAASALSLAAAMIHLWVFPQHLFVWWGYGIFLLTTALVQGVYAVAILRWSAPALALAGIGVNVSVVVLYVFTRTAGIPLGPHAGEIERVGVLDMTATAAELALISALLSLLGGAARRDTINCLLILGAFIWLVRLLGVFS